MVEVPNPDESQRVPSVSGLLVRDDIIREGLIELPQGDEEAEQRCYQPASYDLRLGHEYIIPGREEPGLSQAEILDCRAEGGVTIGPFGSMVVSTYEIINLKPYIVGRFNLRIRQAFRGLIVQIGTQIEPNYRGRLYALLQNITNQNVTIKYKDYETRPFTVEFYYTTSPATNKRREMLALRDFVKDVKLSETLNQILKDQEKLIKRVDDEIKAVGPRWFAIYGVILSLVVTLVVTVVAPWMLKAFMEGGIETAAVSQSAKSTAESAKTTSESVRDENERLTKRIDENQASGANAEKLTKDALELASRQAAAMRDENDRLNKRLTDAEARADAADASLKDALKRITELELKASTSTAPVVAPPPASERTRPRKGRRKVRP